MLAAIKKSWGYMLLQLLFIGYAAQVRPTLLPFPILNMFLLWLIARQYNLSGQRRVKIIIAVSTLFSVLLVNAPSIRNYINNRYFSPTTTSSYNLFDCLGQNVLQRNAQQSVYYKMQQDVNQQASIKEQMAMKNKYAIEIYQKYPLTTLGRMLKITVSILFRNHWNDLGHFWEYHFRELSFTDDRAPFHKSNILAALFYIWRAIYAVLYFYLIIFLINLIRQRNWLFFLTLMVLFGMFIIPFIDGGNRMRIPVEFIMVMCAISVITHTKWYLQLRNVFI